MGLRRRAPRLALAARGVRRSFVSIRRVIEVGPDRRRRAAEAVGDLPDRKAFELAVVPRQCDGSATLDNPIGPPCHTGSRYFVQLVFPSRSARRVLKHQPAPPTRAKHVATRGERNICVRILRPPGSSASCSVLRPCIHDFAGLGALGLDDERAELVTRLADGEEGKRRQAVRPCFCLTAGTLGRQPSRLLDPAASGSHGDSAATATKWKPSPRRSNPSAGSEQVGQFAISRWELAGEFGGVR